MRVDLRDGRCRTCGSELRIVGGDESSLTVECGECRDTYDVQPETFGHHGPIYHSRFLAGQKGGRNT